MKHTFLLLLCCFSLIIAKAQITLSHTFSSTSGQPTSVLFSAHGSKIIANDGAANVIKIYNTDFSLWKTITIPSSGGASGAQFISDHLFNSDDLIEAVVYWPVGTETHAFVINELGTTIMDLGTGYYSTVHYLEGIHKLFLLSTSATSTKVYNLPGELPCGHCGAGSVGVPKTASGTSSSPLVYPNPASNEVTIRHGLPAATTGTLLITNVSGQSLGAWPIAGRHDELTINVAAFPSGFYTVTVLGDGLPPAYGSFVK